MSIVGKVKISYYKVWGYAIVKHVRAPSLLLINRTEEYN